MDGSSKGDAPAPIGFGEVVQMRNSAWVSEFSGHTKGDVLLAELLAIQHGLKIVWEMGFRAVICESDCLDAVQLLTTEVDHHLYLPAS